MRFMLDTNICIELIRKRSPSILRNLLLLKADDVCISSITLSELEYGVAKSISPDRNRAALLEFMAPVEVEPFTDSCAAVYGCVRAHLETKGTPIGALDTLIASHALSLGVTLVTNNEREFRRVPDLVVVSWSS